MRATKTTIRFKLSRAEDARALEYLMSTDQPKKHCDTRQFRQSVL